MEGKQPMVWADAGEFQIWISIYQNALARGQTPPDAAMEADTSVEFCRVRQPKIAAVNNVSNMAPGGRA